jgi:acyl carrier protein
VTTQPLLTVDQVVAAVASVVSRVRGEPATIAPDTELDALELDSLDLAEVFLLCEEVAGRRLDVDSATRVLVVADLADLTAAAG